MRVTTPCVLLLALAACGEHAPPGAGAASTDADAGSSSSAVAPGEGAGPLASLDALDVEVACGQCQFGMEGEGCDLALRVGALTYWLDGTGIDEHGDAHAADGFCNAVRKAVVSGEVVDGRFAVTEFALQP